MDRAVALAGLLGIALIIPAILSGWSQEDGKKTPAARRLILTPTAQHAPGRNQRTQLFGLLGAIDGCVTAFLEASSGWVTMTLS